MDLIREINQREIAIWGTDKEAAETCYRINKKGIAINCFFDNLSKGNEVFLGKRVIKPTKEAIANFYILVACKYNTYLVIAKQLKAWGYKEIEDFCYFDCIDKKVAILHGNCHVDIIRQYLENVDLFVKSYTIYPVPLIFNNTEGNIGEELLKNCDLLITQDIKADNKYGKFLSEEYLKGKLPNRALCITIPNLFGFGTAFFPLTDTNIMNCSLRCGENTNGMFPRKITIIDELLERGLTEQEIVEKISDRELLLAEEIVRNFHECLTKIKDREKQCDVKIYDYIINSYKTEKLFYDPGHPSNYIVKEKVCQILNLLGINERVSDDGVGVMDSYEEPILPCVKVALELKYDCENIRNSKYAFKMSNTMNLEEYIRQYIFYLKYSS